MGRKNKGGRIKNFVRCVICGTVLTRKRGRFCKKHYFPFSLIRSRKSLEGRSDEYIIEKMKTGELKVKTNRVLKSEKIWSYELKE